MPSCSSHILRKTPQAKSLALPEKHRIYDFLLIIYYLVMYLLFCYLLPFYFCLS